MWSSSVRAEQALLGAVLLDPAGQQQVLELVEPADMYRPWHAQVLEAMRRAQGKGLLPEPAQVYRELQNDPDLPATVARDAVPLLGLMEAAPRAGHAGAYAAMVAEGGIRRRLDMAAARMVHTSGTGKLESAWHATATARQEFDACTARWLALPASLRREVPGSSAVTATAHSGYRAGAPQARPQGDEAVAAGVRAVRDLAAAPAQLAGVGEWLEPEHFAWPADGVLYAVMRDMDAAGLPVDPVTVCWQAARRGVRAEPGRLAGGMGPFATASAREVYRQGTLARIAHAGQDIQASSISPRCPPGRLLHLADDRLRTLHAQPEPGPAPQRHDAQPLPDRVVLARRQAPRAEREAVP